jgi:hypothetical protein
MDISDIHSAKGEKFKLTFTAGQTPAGYSEGGFVRMSKVGGDTEFYAETRQGRDLCSADESTADYINDLLQDEEYDTARSLFVVEGVNRSGSGQITGIEVQAYCFRSLTEHKDPIVIKVSRKILEKTTTDLLKKEFVWDGLGQPAVFSLSYKHSARKKADIRLLSGRRFLHAYNTDRGLIASEVEYDRHRNREYLPVDVYIAQSIEFVEEGGEGGVNAEFDGYLEQISEAATYFEHWEAYNDLAQMQIETAAKEFGDVAYDGVKYKDGTRFEFSVSEKISHEYIGSEVEAVTDRDGKTGGVMVGQIEKILDDTLVTYKQDTDRLDYIPPAGQIKLSTRGDKTIAKRRESAKRRMLERNSPIRYIIQLIESGISKFNSESDWGRDKAVTTELKDHFAEAENLNDEQRRALEIAINTPDIALIQGPPGTGKTTVIKAICERFREIFEARQRREGGDEEIKDRPKILISSFQNDAVENAISKPLRGDMPAYRIGSAGKVGEQFQKSLDTWYGGIKKELEKEAQNPAALDVIEQGRKLRDDFFAYKNSGEPVEAAVNIIRKYLSFTEIPYKEELAESARAIIDEIKKRVYAADDTEDLVVKKIKAQRLTRTDFADGDGAREARLLAVHLKTRSDLNVSPEDIGAISAVYYSDEPDDAVFEKYVETVKKLSAKYCPAAARNDLIEIEKGKIDKCILDLAAAYSNGYISMTNDTEAKKALIIGEFLDRFENDYKGLVEKYSLTMAATCQTSLQLKKGGSGICDRDEYDLVIIDEAARANPLDLFIPMSMGRKIILVGDHKQLPQMLEPDVLKLIEDDPRLRDLPDFRISLFERLYGMFSGGQLPKAIQLNTQYRMHPDICDFVSGEFYNDQPLLSGVTAADRAIPPELFDGKAIAYTDIISSKHGFEAGSKDKVRRVEVEAIIKDIKHIFAVSPESTVGVITFYSAQKELLSERVRAALDDVQFSKVEIGTVDAFQGKEFDFVLLSCVRSNKIRGEENMQKSVGFLVKPNRTCVAFSRAKRLLSLYGDAETLNQIDCFEAFFNKCKQEGCYRVY